MTRKLLKNTPIWYLITCIVVFILLVINFFKLDTGINAVALIILSIANAIRNWKNQRSLAMLFLISAALCLFVLLQYLYRFYS